MKRLLSLTTLLLTISFTAFGNCPNVKYSNLKCISLINGERYELQSFSLNNNELTYIDNDGRFALKIPIDRTSDGVKHQGRCESEKLINTQTIVENGNSAITETTFYPDKFTKTGTEVVWDCKQSATNDCDGPNSLWTIGIDKINEICTVTK